MVGDYQFAALAATGKKFDGRFATGHVALTVTGTEDVAYKAALGVEEDTAEADVGGFMDAVAAAEDLVEAAAVDDHMGADGIGSIAAAKDLADGVGTAMDVDIRQFC